MSTPDKKEAIIAEYYGNSLKPEAMYKSMHAAADVQGDAAYTLLQPIFMELYLMKEMSDEEVIEKVTSDFGVNAYNNFNLEVEYADGENRTYTANTTK
nr:YusW family protein [Psychrobacillus soli]